MAKALVDGLEGEGVEQIWSKLNQKNAPDCEKEKPVEDKLFYIDPGAFIKKRRRRKVYKDPNQLSLFDDL